MSAAGILGPNLVRHGWRAITILQNPWTREQRLHIRWYLKETRHERGCIALRRRGRGGRAARAPLRHDNGIWSGKGREGFTLSSDDIKDDRFLAIRATSEKGSHKQCTRHIILPRRKYKFSILGLQVVQHLEALHKFPPPLLLSLEVINLKTRNLKEWNGRVAEGTRSSAAAAFSSLFLPVVTEHSSFHIQECVSSR